MSRKVLMFIALLLSMSAATALTCGVFNTPQSGTLIMSLSNETNAHGELPTESNYGWYLYCENSSYTLGTSCDANPLNLSNATNAHAAAIPAAGYTDQVCISVVETGIECTYSSGALPAGYECLVTLSNETNAHLSSCDAPYDIRIGCRFADNAFPTWKDNATNETATTPRINENITMNVTLNDDLDLNSYTFSWNNSGSWVNDSSVSIGGIEHNVSLSKQVTRVQGETIAWRVWFNDSAGNVNVTDVFTFTVKNTAPTLTSVSSNVTYVRENTPIAITTSGASDADSDTLRLECGTASGLSDLCTGAYGSSERTCTFTSPWTDTQSHTVYCRVNDSLADSTPERTVVLISDNTLPIVTIEYPENTTYNVLTFDLNYTYVEPNCDVVWWGNGTANSSTQACGLNWSALTAFEGSNTWTVYMRDLSGNLNSTSVSFTVDITAPELTVIEPLNDSITNSSSVLFNVSSDKILDSCGLSVDGGANISMALYGDSLGATYTNASMADALYTYVVSCNDTVGNIGYTETTTFRVDTIAPTTTATGNNSNGSAYTFGTLTDSPYVNVTLSCEDTGSGCNATVYCLDTDNTCTPSTVYSAPVQIATQGTSYLRFASNDSAGNHEAVGNVTIVLSDEPLVTLLNPDTDWVVNSDPFLECRAQNNVELANITLYTNITGTWEATNTTSISGNDTTVPFETSGFVEGPYNWTCQACNIAGFCSFAENRTFTVDTTDPTLAFVSITPDDLAVVTDAFVFINVTSSDTHNHSTLIDWNGSLVAWLAMDEYNATHVYDRSIASTNATRQSVEIVEGIYDKAIRLNGTTSIIITNVLGGGT